MTVTYSLDVSSSSFFCLYRLLFRWKGSIWKSVWSELCVWLFIYSVLSVTYRLVLTSKQRELFEDITIFADTYSGFIPITFMLGFYVSAVFTRWGNIFDNMGWVDTPGLMISAHVEGRTEQARNIRRNAVRYMVLCQAIVYRDVSMSVRKRFPTMNHLVTAGFMTKKELEHFDGVASQYKKYWQPMQWIFTELRMARQLGFIASDIIYTDLLDKIRIFRAQVLSLTLYDWVPVPLVYTQVVHLAVRTFFMVALMGRQYLSPTRNLSDVGFKPTIDLYVPIMSILQIIFFIGWIKVAEVMLNPLGEDDDDFETNWILDRNLQVGLSMVDDQFDKAPQIERDAFWEDVMAEPLYTPEAAIRPVNPQIGSCANIPAHLDDLVMLKRNSIQKNNMDDADVVPVSGLDWRRDSHRGSGESLAFSQSFFNQSRKLSEIVRRMRSGRRSTILSYERRPPASARTAEEAPPSPGEDSISQFGESFHNKSMPIMHHNNPNYLHPHSLLHHHHTKQPENGNGGLPNGSTLHHEQDEEADAVMFSTSETLPVIQEEERGKRNSSDSEPSLSRTESEQRRRSDDSIKSNKMRKRAFSG